MIKFTKEEEKKAWEARKNTANFKRNNLSVKKEDLVGGKQKDLSFTNKMKRRSLVRQAKINNGGRLSNEQFIALKVENV